MAQVLMYINFMCFLARDKPDNKKLFGFSFSRLMEPSGATLQVKSNVCTFSYTERFEPLILNV